VALVDSSAAVRASSPSSTFATLSRRAAERRQHGARSTHGKPYCPRKRTNLVDGAPLDYDTETRTLSLNPAKPQRNAAKAQKRAEEKLKADSAKAGQKRRERNDLIVELLAMMLSEPGIAVNEMRRRAPEGCKGPEVNAAVKLAESWNLCRTEPGAEAQQVVLHHFGRGGRIRERLPAEVSESGESDE
jgi:hypothetical protein